MKCAGSPPKACGQCPLPIASNRATRPTSQACALRQDRAVPTANTRLWGRTRIGLRCARGRSLWNVYLPVAVKVYGPAVVASAALPAGTVLNAADLRVEETDWAGEPGKIYSTTDSLLGRTLVRSLPAGQGARGRHLKARQWFAAGEPVRITARGAGGDRFRRSAHCRHRGPKRPRPDRGRPGRHRLARGAALALARSDAVKSKTNPQEGPKVVPTAADTPNMLNGTGASPASGEAHESRKP